MNLLMTDKEKYARDKERIKAIVNHWQQEGQQQVYRRKGRIERLEKLANGVLNPEDYIDYKEERSLFSDDVFEIDDAGLQFYPIIPNILQGILGDFDKKFSRYYAHAVDPEHDNEILSALTSDLRTNLINRAEQAFFTPETTQEEYNEFLNSDKIRNYYLTEYRSTVEQWANHKINVDHERLKMKSIERQVLRDIVVHEMPAVHVKYSQGTYTVENLRAEDCFYIKSKNKDDYSEGQMFGWFEDMTLDVVLNEFAQDLSQRDIERIGGWADGIQDTKFVVNNFQYTGNKQQPFMESRQNYVSGKNLFERRSRRYDDYSSDSVRVTRMYFLLPRKVGELTYRGDGTDITMLVSDDFKVTIRPEYRGKKSKENLISGEHVEWFYINELWHSVQIDVRHNMYRVDPKDTDESTIWVKLEKHPIQYSDPKYRFGIRIPVHGGPLTNYYSDPVSGIERAAPYQVMCNWIGNRMQQLISTEVGKFIIVNQNMIPQDSFDGPWGKNNLLKWFVTAKDVSMAPADPSVTNMGQSATQISGGFGQVVDLTKTSDLLDKLTLFRQLKEECFQQFGFTGQFLYGDYSPKQTGVAVAQSQDRSLTQIQSYYTRLDDIMRRVWDTILETAQYVSSQAGTETISYMGDDKARVIFNTQTDGLLMHKLATFTKSSALDMQDLQSIKQVAMSNNTLGLSAIEAAMVMTTHSTPELMEKLAVIQDKKNRERELQAQQEAERQQQVIQQTHQNNLEVLQREEVQSEREFEQNLVLEQVRALRYANSEVTEIAEEVERMSKRSLEERKLDATVAYREQLDRFRRDQMDHKERQKDKELTLKDKMELKRLELREKEIEASNQRTKKLD